MTQNSENFACIYFYVVVRVGKRAKIVAEREREIVLTQNFINLD